MLIQINPGLHEKTEEKSLLRRVAKRRVASEKFPFLAHVAVRGAAWSFWGMKYGKKFDKCCKD
jgi:hypothetical protein